jgi:hypothetical protein
MGEGITYELEGVSEILDLMDALSSKELTALVRSANRKALSTKIIPPLRAAFSEFGQKIPRATKVVSDKEHRDTGFYAGPDSDVYWVRFQVKGTKIRTSKEGLNRGRILPNDNAIRTIESNVPGVIEFFRKDFGQTMVEFMEKRIKKLNKK